MPPVRGMITDSTGVPLVRNRSSLVVSVNMAVVNDQPDGGKDELRRLAGLLGMRDKLLLQKTRLCTAGVSRPCWAGSPYQPIPVAEDVPQRIALQVLESHRTFPGVSAQVQPVIQYPSPASTAAAQTLGYLQPITPQQVAQRHLTVTGFSGVDLVGQSGLEQQYDRELRGRAGSQEVSVNAAGDVTGTIRRTAPVAGDTLVTSLNAKIQQLTQNALATAIRKTQAAGNLGATTGAAVVMTTTGRVVAMASYPTYDPSVWTGGITKQEFSALFGARDSEPILNRVTQGQYAPGSTWKVTSTAAAVAAGYPLNGLYGCPSALTIGGTVFNNDFPSSGDISFHQALVESCDTVFYQLAYDIWQHDNRQANVVTSARAPVQKMQKMELGWGFGKPTGVDLPAESSGSIPTRAWLYGFYQQYKHYWCSHGKSGGTYIQQINYDDCHVRQHLDPRAGGERVDRPGLRHGHPAAAGPGLRGAGQRRHAVQAADRRGAGQPVRQGGPEDHPASGRAPAGGQVHAGLHPDRARRRAHPGHRRATRSPGSRSASSRWRARPAPPRSRASWRPRCSPRSRR